MKIKADVLNQEWPSLELEEVLYCPYCGSDQNDLTYQSVRDYSFSTAPGEWQYWSCKCCESLYLSPRPTKNSIGKAYKAYYTHLVKDQLFIKVLINRLRMRFKHECLSHWLGAELNPRIGLPKLIGFLLLPLKVLIRIPCELQFLATKPRGSLIDVGCGGGVMLDLAQQLGWTVRGLEIDPIACMAAKNMGLNVTQGSYSEMGKIIEKFDCVLCSHVLEHVHEPRVMLDFMTAALKVNGYLILTLPNANSDLRFRFGKFWRGLEAPRHLSIPTTSHMIATLKSFGYSDIKQHDIYEETLWQSLCIELKETGMPKKNFFLFKLKRLLCGKKFTQRSDYIQLIAKKN